jgi:hypothetical protein
MDQVELSSICCSDFPQRNVEFFIVINLLSCVFQACSASCLLSVASPPVSPRFLPPWGQQRRKQPGLGTSSGPGRRVLPPGDNGRRHFTGGDGDGASDHPRSSATPWPPPRSRSQSPRPRVPPAPGRSPRHALEAELSAGRRGTAWLGRPASEGPDFPLSGSETLSSALGVRPRVPRRTQAPAQASRARDRAGRTRPLTTPSR